MQSHHLFYKQKQSTNIIKTNQTNKFRNTFCWPLTCTARTLYKWPLQLEQVMSYTDGSFDRDRGSGAACGCSFIVLNQVQPDVNAYHYAGFAGGPCIDFDGVSQVNLEGASSGGAELIAILEALIWGVLCASKSFLCILTASPLAISFLVYAFRSKRTLDR